MSGSGRNGAEMTLEINSERGIKAKTANLLWIGGFG